MTKEGTIKTDSKPFVSNVLIMSSAPLLTQIISFLLMPIITRLYSPTVFGLFNIFGSVVGPLTTFSTFGYQQSIVLPKKNQDAVSLVYGSLAIAIFSYIFILFVVLLTPESIWFNLHIHSIRVFWWLIPLSILIHGINVSFIGWNQRATNYSTIVASRVVNAAVNKGFIIVAGIAGYATTGALISGFLIGATTMALVQIAPFLIYLIKDKKLYLYYKQIIAVLKRYKKFPLFIMSSDLLYRMTYSTIIILLVAYFSEAVAGYYGMAIMMTGIPSVLIGTSIGEVFYQKAAKEKDTVHSNEIYIKLFSKLVKLSIFSFLLLAILSNELFTLFLGTKWQAAGSYTQILCFQMFISFIMAPILSLIKVYEKQQFFFYLQLSLLIISIVAIIIGGSLFNEYIAIALLSMFNGVITLLFGLFIFYQTDVPLKNILYIIIKYSTYCAPLALPLVVVKSLYSYSNIEILLLGFFCFMIHYAVLLKTDRDLLLLFKNTINKLRYFKR